MFKLFVFTRTGSLDDEPFRTDFHEFAQNLPGLDRAVINKVLSFSTRQERETVNFDDLRFDHICELAFDGLADMLAAYRQARGSSGAGSWLSPTPGAGRLIPTQTFIQRDDPPLANDQRKLFTPVRKRPDRSHSTFHDHWHSHGPLILERVPGIRGYYQNHTVDAAHLEDAECWGGVAESWFDSLEAISALAETDPKALSAVITDELAFLGPVPIENYVAIPVDQWNAASPQCEQP